MVDVYGHDVGTGIAHTGRGKFRIEDGVDGQYKGKVVDGSDIISPCIDGRLHIADSA